MLKAEESVSVSYRALNQSDLEELLKLYQDKLFIQGYGKIDEDRQTKQQLEDWYEHSIHSLDGYYFSIWIEGSKEWIGFISLTDFNDDQSEAWMSIGIKPTWWGMGIGTKVLTAFIDDCFTNWHLKTLRLSVFSTNHRALMLYQKVGFQVEMIYKQNQAPNWFNTDIYQLSLSQSYEILGE